METIQTEEGPRTRMLVHIGNFDLTQEEQKILALIIENKIKGVNVVKFSDKLEEIATKAFIKYNNKTNEHKPTEPEKQKCSFPEIDLHTSKIDSSRFTGSELVGFEFWKRLDIDNLLISCGFSQKEADLAKVVILGRLISPGSELHTYKWINNQSVLMEYFNTCFSHISKDMIYEIGDKRIFVKNR